MSTPASCRCASLLLALFTCLPCASTLLAQPLSQPARAPALRAPLPESAPLLSIAAPRTVSVSRLLSFNFPISRRQSFTLSTEMVSLSSFYVKTLGAMNKPDWKFKGVPITLGYEYTFVDPDRRIVPVVGVGASYYFCNTRERVAGFAASPAAPYQSSAGFESKNGMGYSVQASLGLRSNLTDNLYVQALGRYRYIDAQAFTGSTLHDTSFPLFDFAIGFGVRL